MLTEANFSAGAVNNKVHSHSAELRKAQKEDFQQIKGICFSPGKGPRMSISRPRSVRNFSRFAFYAR